MSAIKVDTYGGSYNKETSVNFYSSQVSVRFPAMPTEITYKMPESAAFEVYSYTSQLDDLFFKLKKISPDAALELKTQLRDEIWPDDSSEAKRIEQDFKAEMDEIVSHLTALLKAKMLAFVEEKVSLQHRDAQRVIEKYRAILQDKLGE